MNDLFCLIKFGKKNRLESFIKDGDIFFNDVEAYVISNEPERSDLNEGATWLENAQFINIKAEHPDLGTYNYKPKENKLGRIIEYNFDYLSHSLYKITSGNFSKSDTFKISEKMKQFGKYVVIINKPYVFFDAVIKELKRQQIQYEIKPIEYKDLTKEGEFKLSPFIKDEQYAHQHEIRMIIENKENKPRAIQIGSLEDYCTLTKAQTIVEVIWNVRR